MDFYSIHNRRICLSNTWPLWLPSHIHLWHSINLWWCACAFNNLLVVRQMKFQQITQAMDLPRFANTAVLIIMIGFTFVNISAIESNDTYPDYYMVEQTYLQHCSVMRYPHLDYTDLATGHHYSENARNPIKWWFDCVGTKVFDGYNNVLPFIFSLGVIGMTYLLGSQMTGHKSVGIFASFFLCINQLFYNWAATVTYDQIWAFFLLTAVWFSIRRSYLSLPAYILAIFSKSLAGALLPMFLYQVIKSPHPYSYKAKVVFGLIGIVGLGIGYEAMKLTLGTQVSFHPDNIGEGLARAFGIISLSLPMLFGFLGIEMVFRKHSPSIRGRKECFAWMVGIFIISSLIYVFSSQFSFPYRFVPFAAFMSIYIGIVCSRVMLCFQKIAEKKMNVKH